MKVPGVPGLGYGADYAPEQWPAEVWAEDVRLMKAAGVNLATVGVFSWARLQPAPDRFDFEWLDRVMDLLAAHGIAADLATATASPPPWFSKAHPESLPVGPDGRRLWYGSRQEFCPSSPVYRYFAASLVSELATRYAGHPALALWHVNNEYGCHVPRCWCDVSAAAFRTWLRGRYSTLDALNEAWGTDFWSQRYSDWDEIIPPRATPSFPNPTQQLDFRRFSSAELLTCFRAERDILRRLSPGVPVTTNIMAAMIWEVDYWEWAGEMDVLSTDHYVYAPGIPTRESIARSPEAQIAFAADLARSLAGGKPWLLLEHATSAVNWQPRNHAKVPGQLRRESLSYVARGADAVLYFQWRASKAGAEKWHSAMLPHAGTDSKVWQEVADFGAELGDLADLAGSTVQADAAILLDWSSIWAQDHECQPSVDMNPVALLEQWHDAARVAGITCDFAHPSFDLSSYRLVLVPALYLVSDAAAVNLIRYVADGGTVLVGPYSGLVDELDHVRLGGYPGAWRELLGVRVQEHFPLRPDETVALSDGTEGHLWTELATVSDASILATYADGPLAGSPALTRRGNAYYLTTHLPDDALTALLSRLAGTEPPGVEVTRRSHEDGRSYTFLTNHGPAPVVVEGEQVPPGGLTVVRHPAGQESR